MSIGHCVIYLVHSGLAIQAFGQWSGLLTNNWLLCWIKYAGKFWKKNSAVHQ